MNADIDQAVRAALRGNLWIDEEADGIRTEDAVMRIAGAQLKAIAVALTVDEHVNGGPVGWDLNELFTVGDAILAISGISSLLTNAPTMITETREAEPVVARGIAKEPQTATNHPEVTS